MAALYAGNGFGYCAKMALNGAFTALAKQQKALNIRFKGNE